MPYLKACSGNLIKVLYVAWHQQEAWHLPTPLASFSSSSPILACLSFSLFLCTFPIHTLWQHGP